MWYAEWLSNRAHISTKAALSEGLHFYVVSCSAIHIFCFMLACPILFCREFHTTDFVNSTHSIVQADWIVCLFVQWRFTVLSIPEERVNFEFIDRLLGYLRSIWPVWSSDWVHLVFLSLSPSQTSLVTSTCLIVFLNRMANIYFLLWLCLECSIAFDSQLAPLLQNCSSESLHKLWTSWIEVQKRFCVCVCVCVLRMPILNFHGSLTFRQQTTKLMILLLSRFCVHCKFNEDPVVFERLKQTNFFGS